MSLPAIPLALKAAFTAFQTYAPAIQSAISIGSAATGYLSAQGQAQALEQANAQANEQARTQLIEDYDQVGRMAQQERAAAAQKQQENQLNGAKARASVTAAAGEGGVSGLSIDALLGDLYGQEASIRDSINQNLEGTVSQLQAEASGMRRNTLNQMGTRQQPQKPSLLGSAFEAGAGVMEAYRHKFKIGG